MLDVKITQGSFWNGAQIPYWIYMVLTILPFTGALGVDHFVLRSPVTGLLKLLSLIPLFGFWYFYDIAQACGERELVEKYGIGIPYYGPVGIGAGMFSGQGIPESPKETPRPWLFMLYALSTLIFFAFPVNKFIIGDYMNGLFQLSMLLLVLPAIAIGLYDIYNLLVNTKSVFEKGPERFPVFPASFLGSNFDRSVLGPLSKSDGSGLFGIVGKIGEIVAVEGTRTAVQSALMPIQAASAAATATATAATATAEAASSTATATSKAVEGLATLPGAIAKAAQGVSSGIKQSGGSFSTSVSSSPSLSTVALLFSVSVLAFSGYVFYAFRNTYSKPEQSDDPPREPRAV